jgi:hypothetical protein
MDNDLTTSDFYRKFDIAREKGEQFIPSDLRQKVSVQVIEDINRLDASSLNLEQFTENVVNLVRDQFGLYFVGLYLWNGETNWARLWAGSGTIGQLSKERGNPIFLEVSDVPISKAIKLNEIQLIDTIAVWSAKPYMADPLRPDTRLEMALPLQTGKGDVIGSLQICSCIPDSLGSSDIAVFMPITDQIASICADLFMKESGLKP